MYQHRFVTITCNSAFFFFKTARLSSSFLFLFIPIWILDCALCTTFLSNVLADKAFWSVTLASAMISSAALMLFSQCLLSPSMVSCRRLTFLIVLHHFSSFLCLV